MRAQLGHASVAHHHNGIRRLHRGQAVRDHDAGAPLAGTLQCLLHNLKNSGEIAKENGKLNRIKDRANWALVTIISVLVQLKENDSSTKDRAKNWL